MSENNDPQAPKHHVRTPLGQFWLLAFQSPLGLCDRHALAVRQYRCTVRPGFRGVDNRRRRWPAAHVFTWRRAGDVGFRRFRRP